MDDETKSRQEQVLAMHSLNFFFARPFLAPPCSLLPLDVSALELLLREEELAQHLPPWWPFSSLFYIFGRRFNVRSVFLIE